MSEVRPTASRARRGPGARTVPGLELRLERGEAHVRLSSATAAGGLLVETLDLQVPEVSLPFDVGAGPSQFQHRLCDLCALSVRLEPEPLSAAAAQLDLAGLGLASLEVALRQGFAEVAGRLAGGPPFALRLALVPGFERGVTVLPYAPRVFGASAVPPAALPHLAARALAALGLPEDPLPLLLRRVLVARGWKVPREGSVRLAAAGVAPDGVHLAWERELSAPPPRPADPELLAALEGARAFEEAEALVASGELEAAREAYLAAPAAAAHPFGAGRLLSLLCLDERFHDEALDLAAEWLARSPGFPAALCAEAHVRTLRGEPDRAAAALAALAEDAVARGEKLAAAAAAGQALALPGAGREARTRAVDAALAVKRDHLPALRALRDLAREAGDKGAQLRAARRLLAYAPTDAEKGRAHAELGGLLLDKDPPAARLHLDRALRLAPGDPESIQALAGACLKAGEHLRAVRALDQLRALRQEAGDLAGAAALALQAGDLWDGPLDHPENALLRFREAAELGQGAAEAHRRAAACAERLGRWAEAADHHAAALSTLDRQAPGAAAAAAAHHLALAGVAETRLDDPTGAATHLEAALAGLPPDAAPLSRLAGLYRRLGRPAELLSALDRLAPLTAPATARAALLAEAGDLARGPGVARLDLAINRYAAALACDPDCRPAMDGLAAAAAAKGDAAAERDALSRLVPLARDRAEEAGLLDRLASACDRAGDLAGAARAVAAARRAEPTRARLAAAAALARRAGDATGLAGLLDELARACAAAGDAGAAATAWRERAELLEPSHPALALAALAEARAILPGDAALLRRQAGLAERAADHALALGALRALLATDPADAPALELRAARAALAAGEPRQARDHAARADAAGLPGALDLLAEALQRSGDTAGRAGLLSRQGRHLEAAALHEEAGDLAGAGAALAAAAADPATAPAALPRLVALRERLGDAAGAAEALLRLAAATGGREGARLALRAHGLAASPLALDTAAAADPAWAPPRARRALDRAASDPAGARADAEAALAGEGLDEGLRPDLTRLAARLAAAAGDEEAARRHLAAWCDLAAPADADLAELAALHRAAGDEAGLVEALARRLGTAPDAEAVDLRLELAALLAARGRETEAATLWRDALQREPGALPALRALLDPARTLLLADPEREALLARLAGHPGAAAAEQVEAWEALGARREARGDAAGALAARDEAARLRGDDDAGLERRAEAARQAGDLRGAAEALLARAARARRRGQPEAAERLVDGGLAALAGGLDAEGEAALRDALALGPEPDSRREALQALLARGERAGDAAARAALVAGLVPLLPTGERPAALVRLASLRAEAGDVPGALAAAEEARTLAPRDLEAVRAARAAAERAAAWPAVAVRLEEEAALDPAHAGALHLDRARLLARLGEAEAADDAYGEAARGLGPDHALAAEQARHRRERLPDRPAAEPLEAFARRSDDAGAAVGAWLAAAALWLQAGVGGGALRCARRAYARSRATPARAAPLLARLLWEQGAFAEALVLHRALLEAGFPGFDDGDVAVLCRQLGELAVEAGELPLAWAAWDRLLAVRPQDDEAARQRFRCDGDRRRAVAALAETAGRVRSDRARAGLLALAGEAALIELRDRALGERLFREARAEGARVAGLACALERRRAAATRAGDLGPEAALGALHDAADACQEAGEAASARALLEEAVAEELARGMRAAAARDLLQLDALLTAEGDFAGAVDHAARAGDLLAEAGDLPGAADALRRAAAGRPGDAAAWASLAAVAARRGEAGREDLAAARAALVDLAPAGEARAAALVRLAAAEADPALSEAALRRALAEAPADPAAEAALLALLARAGREGERARLILERARRQEDVAVRAGLRREAAKLLSASADPADLALAADALVGVALDLPGDAAAALAAGRALLAAGREDEGQARLAAAARLAPEEDALAAELAGLLDGRPRVRAELHLGRAARATGAARADRLLDAAAALASAGELARAREVTWQAFEAWPADDGAFAAALAGAFEDVERLDTLLAARAAAVPADAPGCQLARADALFAHGLTARAAEAYRAVLALDAGEPAALAALGACLASLHGPEAARDADRALCRAAEAGPERVPASLEAEARYRLGLAGAGGPPERQVDDLSRALLCAPEDPRADRAFAELVQAHLALGDAPAALAAARARAERAAARGEPEAGALALEEGVALAAEHGDAGPDAVALVDAWLAHQVAEGAPLETLVPLAMRAAAAWRGCGDEGRAAAALAQAGVEAARPQAALQPVEPLLDTAPEHEVALEEVSEEAPGEPPSEPVVLEDLGGEAGPAPEPVVAPVAEAADAPAEGADSISASLAEALSAEGLDLAGEAPPVEAAAAPEAGPAEAPLPAIQARVTAPWLSRDDLAAKEGAAAAPDAAAPVVEEASALEPSAGAPVADEPVADEAVAPLPAAFEPVAEEAVVAQPVVDETDAVQPVAEPPAAQVPAEAAPRPPPFPAPADEPASAPEAAEPPAPAPGPEVDALAIPARLTAPWLNLAELRAGEGAPEAAPIPGGPTAGAPANEAPADLAAEPAAAQPDAFQPDAIRPDGAQPAEPQPDADAPVAVEAVASEPAAEPTAEPPTTVEAVTEASPEAPIHDLADVVPEGAAEPEAVVALEPVLPPAAAEAAPEDARARAALLADLAAHTADPVEQAAAWLASAEALERAGAPADDVRAALTLACDADPDGAEAWRALASLEARQGRSGDAARAWLAVSIRSDGEGAAQAAYTAARLFVADGRHAEAVRSLRAANLARPKLVPPELILAGEALARGAPEAAAETLRLLEPATLEDEARAIHAMATAQAEAALSAGAPTWAAEPEPEPAPDLETEATVDLEPVSFAAPDLAPGPAAEPDDAPTPVAALAGEPDATLDPRADASATLDLETAPASAFDHGQDQDRDAASAGAPPPPPEAAPDLGPDLDTASSPSPTPSPSPSLDLSPDPNLGPDPDRAPTAAPDPDLAATLAALPSLDLDRDLGLTSEAPPPPEASPEPEPETSPEPAPAPEDDPVAAVLRAQADAADGPDRASYLERLAGHLERHASAGAAADALMEALAADPQRELTWGWLEALVEGDAARTARATSLRAMLLEPDLPLAAPGGTDPWVPVAPPPDDAPLLPEAAPSEDAAQVVEVEASQLLEEGEIADLGVHLDGEGTDVPAGADTDLDRDADRDRNRDSDRDSDRDPDRDPHRDPDPHPDRDLASPPWPAPADDETSFAGLAEAVEPPASEAGPPATAIPSGTDPYVPAALPPRAPARPTLLALPMLPPVGPAEPPVLAAPPPVTLEPPEPPTPAGPADAPFTPIRATTAPWLTLSDLQAAEQAEVQPAGPVLPDEEPPEATGAIPLDLTPAPDVAPALTPWLTLSDLGTGDPAPGASRPEPTPEPVPVPVPELTPDPVLVPERTPEPEPLAAAAAPDPGPALLEQLRELVAAGDRAALWAAAADAEAQLGEAALRPWAAQLGRAALEARDAEGAHRWLTLARQDDPEELTIARDLSRAAERTGRRAEEVALGELCADSLAPHDPLAAAARYRYLAGVLADHVGDPAAAASLVEKAITLSPGDPDAERDLWALWARRPATAGRALEAWLDAARRDPADAVALSQVAELCERQAAGAAPEQAARLHERARLAASLAAFAAPGRVAPPMQPAALVPDAARERVAAPGAVGALGRLLSLLSPYLEPLFPADLARRGATAADRLVPPRAPGIRAALDGAGQVLSARPWVGFVVERPGVEVLVENTQPAALVIPAGLEALPEAATWFLAARTLDLLGRGWALVGKFAPRDVGILLELACRFAGGAPPPMGLPPQRADAFLAALARAVPPSVTAQARPLGPAAAEELARTDVRTLSAALRRTSARVALLAGGDPGAALYALTLLDRALAAQPDAAAALAQPDLRDLALLALSDPFVDLRVAVRG